MRKELDATVEAFEKAASQDMVEAGTMMASDCYARSHDIAQRWTFGARYISLTIEKSSSARPSSVYRELLQG